MRLDASVHGVALRIVTHLGVPGTVFLILNDTPRSSDSDHIIAEKVC